MGLEGLVVKRIPQLPAGTNAQPSWLIAIYDPTTNTTKRITVDSFLNEESTGNYDWDSGTTYATNEVVFYNNTLWASDVGSNLNNTPQAGAFWTQVPSGLAGGLKRWAVGAFTADEVFVVYDNGSGDALYTLDNVTRPFNSTNFVTELAATDWVIFNTPATDIAFDSNRPIKSTPIVGENLNKASLVDFIEAGFYREIVATITQNIYSLQEVGVSYAITVTGTITPNDSTITARRVREVIGNTVVATPAGNAVSELLSAITMAHGVNKTYRIEADVTTDAVGTTEISVDRDLEAAYPYFHGFGVAALTGNPLYVGLTKQVVSQSSKSLDFSGTNEKMYIAFDADYPDLTSIKDPNGFEILGATFPASPTTLNVVASGLANNWTKSYKVYESVSNTTANGTFNIVH